MNPPASQHSTILVVDDHPVVRGGLAAVAASMDGVRVCGECADGDSALNAVRRFKPDLVILDLMLGKESALPLIARLRNAHPGVAVLVFSMHDEEIFAARSIKAGANGYVMKGVGTEVLHQAITTVLAGELYVSDHIRSQMLRHISGQGTIRTDSDLTGLTASELAVLQMLGSGLDIREIAERIGRSPRTVEAHRNNIRLKLNLPNSSALVRFATQWVQAST